MNYADIFPDDLKVWIRMNPGNSSIIIMRTMMSLLWLSQGMAKIIFRSDDMYADFNDFLGQLNWSRETHPISFIATILEKILIPNYIVFVILIIIIELSIGISLGLGLFTRFGAFAGAIMTINLWILTLGWGDWLWTYPLIFMPHFVLFFTRSGDDIGLDRLLKKN